MTEATRPGAEQTGIDTGVLPSDIPEMAILEELAAMAARDLGIPENVLSGEVVPELPSAVINKMPVSGQTPPKPAA